MRQADEVIKEDVNEATRLIEMSKYSLYEDGDRQAGINPVDAVYGIIRDAALASGGKSISFEEARQRSLAKG